MQHSMFSSGVANTSLAVGELFKALGHEVTLVTISDKSWWDDCEGAKADWAVVPVADATGFDLLVEIDRMMLPPDKRKKVANTAIWLVRHPFLIR